MAQIRELVKDEEEREERPCAGVLGRVSCKLQR